MNVMISQPIKERAAYERLEREAADALEAKGHRVLSTPEDPEDAPLRRLGRRLSAMNEADAVFFLRGWRDARECVVEHLAAEKFGLWIIHQS